MATTNYTCTDCTGKTDELVVFTVRVDGEDYAYKRQLSCPICGQIHPVKTVTEYLQGRDDERYTVS